MDKKRDKALTEALTAVCEKALEQIPGFEWLTHDVDFQRPEQSLRITCVFATSADIEMAREQGLLQCLQAWIKISLKEQAIALATPGKQIVYDAESACQSQHGGNWALRLTRH
jgi:hypothetical protein